MISQLPATTPSDELSLIEKMLTLIEERLACYENRFQELALKHQAAGKRLETLKQLAESFNITPPGE